MTSGKEVKNNGRRTLLQRTFHENPRNAEQAYYHGLVTFVDDIRIVNLSEMGPKLEKHPLFPDRTNVEFAQITGENTIRMRVWERGSGITQACGTGACATAVAAHLTGRTGRTVNVVMDGGTLTIEWDEATGHISMTGPAVKVFDGTIELRE